MIFDNVKSIVIPEGSVKEITCNNVTLWQKIRIIIETVSGVGTIVLQKIIQLVSITQYGKCEQASTPTPSVPVDIKCNNGTLECRMASGLPVGYKKLSYIESTGTQYINTGFAIPDLTNEYKVDYKISVSGGTGQGASSNNWGYMGQNGCLMLTLTGTNGVGAGSEGVPWVADHIYAVSHHRGSDASRSVTVDGTTFQFGNQTTVYADREFGIFSLSPFTTVFNRIYGKLYEFQAYKNDELVMSFIPCKRMSDNAIGIYDIVNDTFIGNSGTDTFIAGADDDEAYIDVVGTPEVLTVSGANMLNPTTVPNDGKYIARVNGQVAGTGNTWAHSGFIPVEEGKKYYFGYKPFTASTAGMAWYDLSKTYISGKSATEIKNSSQKLTAPSGASFVRFSWSTANGYDTDWRNTVYFCENGVMTKFEPYVTPQTASVANLFAVGDDKDEHEIVSGDVIRACGIKILDGTETWTTDTYGGYRRMVLQEVLNASGDTLSVTCSHYVSRSSDARQQPNSIFIASTGKMVIYVDSTQNITTVDEFNAWLAAQYANGTPVIIVYPLAEATTESVTPQSFTVNETAIISAESDYVDDIALSGTYETPEA